MRKDGQSGSPVLLWTAARDTTISGDANDRSLPRRAIDFVNGVVGERHHEKIAVRAGFDIGCDAEIGADEQTLAFSEVELVGIVRDAIFKPRINGHDFSAIAREPEMEEI